MTIDIWADVVCPFCYIGKRQFERALESFEHKDKVTIKYRSFELNPGAPKATGKTPHEFLAERKGISVEEAKQLNDEVTTYAKSVGLTYDLDHAHPANSFDAHRLVHLAKKHGLEQKMVDRLYAAYFTEAVNIENREHLTRLAMEVGLQEEGVRKVLASNTFRTDVLADQAQAVSFGITGVPCFIFDEKLAVIGAHQPEHFLSALKKAWETSILK